ncbi:hypothetical protein [Alloprevotella rava]|nr:hypothetical protein [Alloprevotella rava]
MQRKVEMTRHEPFALRYVRSTDTEDRFGCLQPRKKNAKMTDG